MKPSLETAKQCASSMLYPPLSHFQSFMVGRESYGFRWSSAPLFLKNPFNEVVYEFTLF